MISNMETRKTLMELLCILIDIQIKKYKALTNIGIGPDARLNTEIVIREVDELISFADTLLYELDNNVRIQDSTFQSIFNQIKFYLEQEYNRGYAGWLLDDNHIHTPALNRVKDQIEEMRKLAKSARIPFTKESPPLTETQKHCQFDSWCIADYILDLALKLQKNPNMPLDDDIIAHARPYLRANAVSRYKQKPFCHEILQLHDKYALLISQSELIKTGLRLEKQEILEQSIIHTSKLQDILSHYEIIEPSSKLFSPEFEWFRVGISPKVSLEKNKHSLNKNILYSAAITVGGLCVYMLLSYFSKMQEESALQHLSENSI